MATIGFLHTSTVHTATFADLVHELAPEIGTAAVVDEALLSDARRFGADDGRVVGGIDAALDHLDAAGSTIVVCTCSTIGGIAEELGRRRRVPVLRVDRPMAVAAVRHGPRVAVVAALESTVAPTRRLIESVAGDEGAHVEITDVVSPGAWECFEAGDLDGYLDRIATTCATLVDHCDAIVLAQASMAAAAARVRTDVPILSSPRLAVRDAVALARG